MLSNPVKVLIAFVVVGALAIVIVKAMKGSNNNLKSRKNKMMRQPMMVRNGRVVSPTMMNSMSEGFSDQYTVNSNVQAQNPIFMNSVPDSPKNPWVGSIASIDM